MFLLFRYLATKGSENLLELINNPGAEKLLTAKEPILLLVPIESIGGMFIIFILFKSENLFNKSKESFDIKSLHTITAHNLPC